MSAGGHRNGMDRGRTASGLRLSWRRLEGGDWAQHEVRVRPKTGFEGVRRQRDKMNENAGSASKHSRERERGRGLYSCAKRRGGSMLERARLTAPWQTTLTGGFSLGVIYEHLKFTRRQSYVAKR
jgi:hypothetical protein